MNAPFDNNDKHKFQTIPEQDLSRLAHNYADEVQAELIARLQEQETLRKSEARYRDFFDNAKE
jgi:hypothetical protein